MPFNIELKHAAFCCLACNLPAILPAEVPPRLPPTPVEFPLVSLVSPLPPAKQGAAAAGTDAAAAALSAHAQAGSAEVQGKATPRAGKAAADDKGGAVGKVVSAVRNFVCWLGMLVCIQCVHSRCVVARTSHMLATQLVAQ